MIILASSTPSSAGVAPYGGTRALLTPNPLAAGIPTRGDPVLIDISASITTMNRARQLTLAGRMFPQPWALDAQGNPSDDPAAVVSRGGSLLPVGGLDHGHKGFGLAILVEALTQALAGFGRADRPTGSSVSVYLQVIDPDAFGGQDGFTRQSTFLADACRSSPPRPGVDGVRMPGERALALREAALAEGVPLSPEITTQLASRARGFGLPFPSSRNS
jgi:L-lactate dehydrogenase